MTHLCQIARNILFSLLHLLISGHKFAGNVIVYPSGTWYGRVLTCHIPLLIDAYTSSSEELKSKLQPLFRGHLDTAW
ncbi:unnamed protein product [Rotaria magnacalcarata]